MLRIERYATAIFRIDGVMSRATSDDPTCPRDFCLKLEYESIKHVQRSSESQLGQFQQPALPCHVMRGKTPTHHVKIYLPLTPAYTSSETSAQTNSQPPSLYDTFLPSPPLEAISIPLAVPAVPSLANATLRLRGCNPWDVSPRAFSPWTKIVFVRRNPVDVFPSRFLYLWIGPS